MRAADVDECCILFGGRNILNLRYADDTALCANYHVDAINIYKLDAAGVKSEILNARKTGFVLIMKHYYSPITISKAEEDQKQIISIASRIVQGRKYRNLYHYRKERDDQRGIAGS
ncbi:hypothetical protein PoB_003972300 [Plakobranchus ocellatus]|uniref:Reverse transcriptase domain-containing protein n=1 Tax=Plakobranchus ocellatus TaxID=259542 RepID=A0AAV4B276_9GAST|nr:hypothetical protein PoB_003972300 [Plakobranchus ocellatus]